MKLRIGCGVVGFLLLVLSLAAQTAGSSPVSAQVPPLIQFSNVATDEGGNSLSGVASITFSLYNSQQGGEPLWTETQNDVPLDPTGHYSVQLGVTNPTGVPTALFTTGEARWLGVRIAEQREQPRILLLSVPYALKAGDAATIGGFPPSAFVLAAPPTGASDTASTPAATTTASASPSTAADVTTTGGTINYLPIFSGADTIVDSGVYQTGSGATAKVGINTTTPATALDVKGAATIRGALSLPATGAATATAGANSQPLNLAASAFNSGTSAAANQTFRWQVEPAGNDTAAPSGTLSLLFGEGTATPAETGLSIASNGVITFATGQSFSSNSGTVTSVGSGAGLTGGPITTEGTLSIATGGVTNAMLVNPSLTVTAGTGLTGGGSVALGDSTTLNVNDKVVPLLAAASNTFTGNLTVEGTLLLDITGINQGLALTNSSPGVGESITNTDVGEGMYIANTGTSTGDGLYVANIGIGNGMLLTNSSIGDGIYLANSSTGFGMALKNTSSGVGMVINSNGGTGLDIAQTGGNANGLVVGASSNGDYPAAWLTNNTPLGFAVIGIETDTTAASGGVKGITDSSVAGAIGVYGVDVEGDQTELNDSPTGVGVIGDASVGWGVMGLSDQGQGVTGVSADTLNEGIATAFFDNTNSDAKALVLQTYGYNVHGECNIDVSGNLGCTGTVGTTTDDVQVDGSARKVALSVIEAPEHWFEDAGSAQLSSGEAVVHLEPIFGQTVNTEMEYHVFLTPKGDCKGLYVTNETATSFVVRELGGGTSSIAFDYRIMAKRRGYEGIRMADVTKQFRKPASKTSINGVAQPHKYQPPTPPAHRNGSILPVSNAVRPVPTAVRPVPPPVHAVTERKQ